MENGFLTSASDYKKIKTASFQKKYIDGLTDGIMDYFISIKSGSTNSKNNATTNRVIVPSTSRPPVKPK